MKPIAFFVWLCFLVLAVIGCDAGRTIEPTVSQLYGSWQWESSQGGWGGELRTPKSTGETRKAIFRADGIVQFFQNDVLVNHLRFTIENHSYPNSSEYNIIRYLGSNQCPPDQYISFENLDMLHLSDTCMDCFHHVFSRMH